MIGDMRRRRMKQYLEQKSAQIIKQTIGEGKYNKRKERIRNRKEIRDLHKRISELEKKDEK